MLELKYDDLPYAWPVCFLDQCPRKGECLHYKAGTLIPDDRETAYVVAPTVLRKPQCPCFLPIQVVRAAVGFKHIFGDVKTRHAPQIREDIKSYLRGNSNYYRYLHGQQMLMPEQQQWIRDLFKSYGYTHEIEFDGYQDVYRFYSE